METVRHVDIVADLSWGDTGKGKITSYLSRNNKYDFVCRWAGGNNAGHTVYINGNKYKTHLIPSGIFHGITSIIGPACVINLDSFLEEVRYLSDNGFDTSLIKVSPRAHVVTDEHIEEDKTKLAKTLGTTSKGIAPCYRDKMARTGTLAKDVIADEFLWDEVLYGDVLCEGAQGFYLDIDWGNYPYVTSSTTLPYGACSLGFPPQKIRNIWGICKAYDTRSGVDPLFPKTLLQDDELAKLGDIGMEYGVTTGRRRVCNWLNLDMLIKAAEISGATSLVINKCDVLEENGVYKCQYQDKLVTFENLAQMKMFIRNKLGKANTLIKEYHFSHSPEEL